MNYSVAQESDVDPTEFMLIDDEFEEVAAEEDYEFKDEEDKIFYLTGTDASM